jgi:hypothetical protein
MTDSAQTGSSEGGNGVAEKTQDTAKRVASQAQDKARETAGQARGRIRDEVDQRSTVLGDQLSSSASDARSVAEQLRNQGKQTPASYVEQAADRAERFGGYLRDSDGEWVLSDAEDFARRNTWAVALAGLAVGFAASRLLKASTAHRYHSSLRSSDPAAVTASSSDRLGPTGGGFTREAGPSGGDVAEPGPAAATTPTTDRPGFAGESLGTVESRPRPKEYS